jgi:hypothetical protein
MNFVSFIRRLRPVIDLENYSGTQFYYSTLHTGQLSTYHTQCHVTAASVICQLQFSSHSRSKSLKSISHTHSMPARCTRAQARVLSPWLSKLARRHLTPTASKCAPAASPRWLSIINLCIAPHHTQN